MRNNCTASIVFQIGEYSYHSLVASTIDFSYEMQSLLCAIAVILSNNTISFFHNALNLFQSITGIAVH